LGIVTIGTVLGSEVTKNKDADEDSRILQVELTNTDDVQSIEQMGQVGEDSSPQPGARVIVLDLSPSYRVAVAAEDGVTPAVADGEKEFYSYDSSGSKLATIRLLSDASIELNGNTDFAVAFDDLKVAFDQLRDDFNDFVSTVFNVHAHPGVTAGAASTGPPPVGGSPSSADMAGAKVDSIKVP
jgi:phage gp45-like